LHSASFLLTGRQLWSLWWLGWQLAYAVDEMIRSKGTKHAYFMVSIPWDRGYILVPSLCYQQQRIDDLCRPQPQDNRRKGPSNRLSHGTNSLWLTGILATEGTKITWWR
jgi:hypothetical protein